MLELALSRPEDVSDRTAKDQEPLGSSPTLNVVTVAPYTTAVELRLSTVPHSTR